MALNKKYLTAILINFIGTASMIYVGTYVLGTMYVYATMFIGSLYIVNYFRKHSTDEMIQDRIEV